MQQLKTLAPTIIDAFVAVEQGCRQVHNDQHFQVDIGSWLRIIDNACYGCLATVTLMQLAKMTSKTLLQHFVSSTNQIVQTTQESRALAFGLDFESLSNRVSFSWFESVIDYLRYSDIAGLLAFYNLQDHENAIEAKQWVYDNQPADIGMEADKSDLLKYADFLKNELIPRMTNWFPGN